MGEKIAQIAFVISCCRASTLILCMIHFWRSTCRINSCCNSCHQMFSFTSNALQILYEGIIHLKTILNLIIQKIWNKKQFSPGIKIYSCFKCMIAIRFEWYLVSEYINTHMSIIFKETSFELLLIKFIILSTNKVFDLMFVSVYVCCEMWLFLKANFFFLNEAEETNWNTWGWNKWYNNYVVKEQSYV